MNLIRLALFATSALMTSASIGETINCTFHGGESRQTKIAFDGQNVFVGSQSLSCEEIPMSFSTVRKFPEGVYAIAFLCGATTSVYGNEGPNANHVFYVEYDENIYRCEFRENS